MRKNVSILFILFTLSIATAVQASQYYNDCDNRSRKESRYDYIYMNPPRQSLGAYGRYIFSSAKVRYVHSPSKLKRDRHEAMVNANNMLYAYGY